MVCVHVVDLNCVLWRAVSDGEDEDPEVQPRPSRRRLLHHRHAQILQQGIRRFPLEAIRATSCCRRSAVPPPVLPVLIPLLFTPHILSLFLSIILSVLIVLVAS